MKKLAVYMAMLLWVVAIFDRKDEAVRAFNANSLYTEYSQINVFAKYSTDYLSLERKKKLLEECAKTIGISNYEIENVKEGNRVTSVLTKNGKNAKTSIKIITIEEQNENKIVEATNYLMVDLIFYWDYESLKYYKEVLSDMFKDKDLKPQISTSIVSSVPGTKTLDEKSAMADEILKDLDAKIVSQNRNEDIFTIYAYSNDIDEYVVSMGKKVNVNIAVSYDETSDKTFLYFGTPIYNTDY